MEQAREAGAAIVKPAQETFYGEYAGYFTDLDGHLWDGRVESGQFAGGGLT